MSLALAAKHIESQGRNKDTKLVHMTPDELKALNKLSIDHVGKPLSTNPKTGLPEAGFLSSILPTVAGIAGAAMGIPLPLVIGGVGLATAALTGDIGQGIMAGLGAWSGGKLGADIANASTLAQTNAAAIPTQTFSATQAASKLGTTMEPFKETLGRSFTVDPTKQFLGQSFAPSTSNAIASQAKNFVPDLAGSASNIVPKFDVAGNALNFPQGVSAAPTDFARFQSGWEAVKADPMKFIRDNPMNVAGAALGPVAGLLEIQQPTIPGAKQEENPFGLKRLSPDFRGSFPEQPNPYYTAQYPDYRARPYGMNEGGLSDINTYASGKKVDYSKAAKSMKNVEAGIGMMEIQPLMQESERPDVGIYADERKYASMDPYERALEMLKDIKGASGISTRGLPNIKRVAGLGAISSEPAMVEAELANQARRQIATEAKSGGLMDGHLGDYSDGGRLLKGPGDGVSDSIPATIGGKQAARLAEGEFVIPARIVSELGNGSTDAGAKRLYAMMDRIKAKRRKAKDIAADTKAYKLLPAQDKIMGMGSSGFNTSSPFSRRITSRSQPQNNSQMGSWSNLPQAIAPNVYQPSYSNIPAPQVNGEAFNSGVNSDSGIAAILAGLYSSGVFNQQNTNPYAPQGTVGSFSGIPYGQQQESMFSRPGLNYNPYGGYQGQSWNPYGNYYTANNSMGGGNTSNNVAPPPRTTGPDALQQLSFMMQNNQYQNTQI